MADKFACACIHLLAILVPYAKFNKSRNQLKEKAAIKILKARNDWMGMAHPPKPATCINTQAMNIIVI